MGINVDLWRARIGTFCQSYRLTKTIKSAQTQKVVRTIYLHPAQCVEVNPGPTKGRGSRAHKNTSSAIRGAPGVISSSQPLQDHSSVRCTERASSQASIRSWVNKCDISYHSDSETEAENLATASLLLEIRSDVKSLTKNMKSLNSKFDNLST